MKQLSYRQAVDWLDSTQHLGMKPGLERITYLLDHLDHPEKIFPKIHVGGTNGKGSVCRYLSSILIQEGYTVGVFTSPHLMSIRERFTVNDELIPENEFAALVTTLKEIVDTLDNPTLRPTYFEICTALMFLYFHKKQVDYAIIEVGLGGRYDATNVIEPLLSIITNVSLDHTDVLGQTIEEISYEKAGIIKDCVPLVTAAKGNALTIIEKEVKAHHTSLVHVSDTKRSVIEQTQAYQLIRIEGMLDIYELKTYEIGAYQRENLAVAITAVEQLQLLGVFISPDSIKDGVEQMHHPGRMKVIHTRPTVIVDGAHNPGGIHEVKSTLYSLFPDRNIILVFGVLKDKNIKEMIETLSTICGMIIITRPKNERAAEPDLVEKIAISFFPDEQILITKTIKEAIRKGLNQVKNDDILLFTGSFYLLPDVMNYFDNTKNC
jgi:dihydrofolate synthase/folylpolyglutamate synthase